MSEPCEHTNPEAQEAQEERIEVFLEGKSFDELITIFKIKTSVESLFREMLILSTAPDKYADYLKFFLKEFETAGCARTLQYRKPFAKCLATLQEQIALEPENPNHKLC